VLMILASKVMEDAEGLYLKGHSGSSLLLHNGCSK
jgi:hypothetical protein